MAEADLTEQVRRHVLNHIIMKLNDLPPKDTSVGLLEGLESLADDTNLRETQMMAVLFKDFFPKWLSEIKELVIYKTKSSATEIKTKQIDAILSLLRASLKDDKDNIYMCVKMGMHEEIAAIFTKTASHKSRYLHLMECMTEIAKLSQSAASDFINSQLHIPLIQDTKLTFYEYKKH